MPSSHSDCEITTVGELRRYLARLDDDQALIVVPCGIGYEHPRVLSAAIKPVLVRNRFLSDGEATGFNAYALRPING